MNPPGPDSTPRDEPVIRGDLAVYLPENIREFDAIVMNNSSGSWITPTEADLATDAFKRHGADRAAVEQVLRRSLLDYLTNGAGMVSLHCAIAANAHWPKFRELLGGKFTGHPWNEEIGVEWSNPLVPWWRRSAERTFVLPTKFTSRRQAGAQNGSGKHHLHVGSFGGCSGKTSLSSPAAGKL